MQGHWRFSSYIQYCICSYAKRISWNGVRSKLLKSLVNAGLANPRLVQLFMVRRDFALECTHEAEGPEVAEPARGHCRRFCCRRPDRLRRLHDDQDEHPEAGRWQR